MTTEWTPAMQAWLDQTLARATPLTIFQENAVKAEFRKIALSDQAA
ncbi:hypothetical protein [Rhodococcus sp. SGAir0479]|nr:hypothetical protein [Rhodococcus sp. SGAir0479]